MSKSSPSPLISLVIPIRNRADQHRKALASVANQHFPRSDYEVIVVDNGSTDKTADIALGFRGEVKIDCIRENHMGISADPMRLKTIA